MWLRMPPDGKNIRKIVETIGKNGIEQVFIQAIDIEGYANYESKLRPRRYGNSDAFRRLCEGFKKEGIETHAWICVNIASKEILERKGVRIALNRFGNMFVDTREVTQDIKNWKPRYWACPSDQNYREDICGVVKELIKGHDLDGIHLDYIRYPDKLLMPYMSKKYSKTRLAEVREEADFCYCEDCKNEFRKRFEVLPENKMYNSESWAKWRRDNVTKTVGEIFKASTGKIFSASVFATPEIASSYVFQDIKGFSKYLDFLVPMIYNKYYNKEIGWVETAVKENRKIFKKKLLAGIGPVHLLKATEISKGISAARKAGADGFSIFCYDQMNASMWKKIKNYGS